MRKEPSQVPGDKMNKTSGVTGPENSDPSGSSAAREQEPAFWGVGKVREGSRDGR